MTQGTAPIARENMLKSQILTGHVLNPRILAAFGAVTRDRFVPEAFAGAAYVDSEIPLELGPLSGGRFLMEPLTFARLLEHAAIEPHETVLDVACATGYSAAVLSHLAGKVVALEEYPALAVRAKALLAAYPNVACESGPLVKGVSRLAPYDAIIIEGAIEILPAALGDQLREGGRLLVIERAAAAKTALSGPGKLTEYKKVRGNLYKACLRDASVPLLQAFCKPPVFAL